MDALQQFIATTNDARELKRAMVVQIRQQGYSYAQIESLLQVSESFIVKWQRLFQSQGVEGLKLGYWGTQGYLKATEKQAVMAWLQQQQTCQLEELVTHIEATYGVVFQAKQSYYDLLHQAGLSWKKTQAQRPQKDEAQVAKKHEIMELLMKWRSEIASGQVRVLLLDECHLLWGDICGYVWGQTNQRIEVPIASERQRQTYYGVFDYHSQQFYVQAYEAGNTHNTIAFLKYLRALDEQSRLLIIWDGASYHRSHQLRDYLAQVNTGLASPEWNITCMQFAPHAPEQNPVEDIWLQAKQFIRKFFTLGKSFAVVKYLFELVTHQQRFTFEKAFMYG